MKLDEEATTKAFIFSEMAREGEGYGGAKRLAIATNNSERCGRFWRNGQKEPRATDFLLMARSFAGMKARVKRFLDIPDRLLHRYHDILNAMEAQRAQVDRCAADVLARFESERPSFRRTALRALGAAAWGVKHPIQTAKAVKASKARRAQAGEVSL